MEEAGYQSWLTGSTGQLSNTTVGQNTADALMKKLVPRVESLKIGPSTDANADYGPLVTREAVEKVKVTPYVERVAASDNLRFALEGSNSSEAAWGAKAETPKVETSTK